MLKRTYKKWLAIIATTAAILGTYQIGWLETIWLADQSYISSLIAVMFVLSWWCILKDKWLTADWIAEQLPNLGLLGTIIGFVLAFSALDPAQAVNAEGAKAMVQALVSGISVSLYTTLVGCVGYLWIAAMRHWFHE